MLQLFKRGWRICQIIVLGIFVPECLLGSADAEEALVRVAVAANFSAPMQLLSNDFYHKTGIHVVYSTAGTGQLYAQIVNGAPFQVLLAADSATPQRLIKAHRAVASSLFTYATGVLVLWSADPALVDKQGRILQSGRFRHLAVAQAKNAPYGAAAMEVLQHMGLQSTLQPLIVQGEDINQTWQFVQSGNAELGFVALAQVLHPGKVLPGSLWVVPQTLYSVLDQKAVLLQNASNQPAALAWMRYLRSAATQRLIRGFGYAVHPQ